jgi:hypothetical protein
MLTGHNSAHSACIHISASPRSRDDRLSDSQPRHPTQANHSILTQDHHETRQSLHLTAVNLSNIAPSDSDGMCPVHQNTTVDSQSQELYGVTGTRAHARTHAHETTSSENHPSQSLRVGVCVLYFLPAQQHTAARRRCRAPLALSSRPSREILGRSSGGPQTSSTSPQRP